jgi:hypothetical protein
MSSAFNDAPVIELYSGICIKPPWRTRIASTTGDFQWGAKPENPEYKSKILEAKDW